jgi:signal transduction histidine kinase
VEGDRHILASAVANLLQSAFKFSGGDCHVVLRAYASKGRVLIEVEDDGPGLPEALAQELLRPLERHAGNQGGMGTGLAISRKAVEAVGGKLSARDIPGTGCIFTIDLPQKRVE